MIAVKTMHSSQRGLSLVELMVALVTGLILTGGVLQVFVSNQKTYSLNTDLAVIQENARFATEYMIRDIRMAGYSGCNTGSNVANVLKPGSANISLDFSDGIRGLDGDGSSDAISDMKFGSPSIPVTGFPKSDVLTILRAESNNALTVTGHNTNSAVIDVGQAHGFTNGKLLYVSDCQHAAIFQTTGGNPNKLGHNTGSSETPGNCTKALGWPVVCSNSSSANYKQYGSDATVMEALVHAYFIKEKNNIPALYRRELVQDGVTEDDELVQGVENMQVRYGLDTDEDGVANRFVAAQHVPDDQWKRVVSVRTWFLLRSFVPVTEQPGKFSFMGDSYTATDRYLRKEVVMTVKVRNRGATEI